jgi:transposase
MVEKFLDGLSKRIAKGKHVALIWDGAGYHRAKALRVPANITLVSLPPRAPELNPVENLWHYLRSHHWSNRTYKNLDAVEKAAVKGWRRVCLKPELIRTICACHYLPASC